MRLGAWWMPVGLLAAACGTVDSGGGEELSIRGSTLPDAVVGRDYQERNVVLEASRGSGVLSWSLPQLPPSLLWLTVGESTGQLAGRPLDVVAPGAAFVVQVTNGSATARQPFSLAVGCQEGATSPCGVPDTVAAMCIAGSRLCLNGALGGCAADVGRPPYEADASHCGAGCDETCPRTSTNRCIGTCSCGSSGAPCGGATPACCPGNDGRPESFGCVSLQTREHCGACQTACPDRPNAQPGCANSACTFACAAEYRNCNGGGQTEQGPDADGCETRVVDNPESCGVCGHRCPDTLDLRMHAKPGRSCQGGVCVYTCAGSWRNCTGSVAPSCARTFTQDDPDGCEVDFGSVQSCNGARVPCPGIDNGFATCTGDTPDPEASSAFSCGLRCNPGFDPDPCGAPLACKRLNDPANCGTCGRACPEIGTDELNQFCSSAGQCCIQACDPSARPPCGPVVCQ